jgi:8-oxo-dGTP diphosphatase
MTREYPQRPIVGVGAVILEGDQVVLVRRGRPPAYGEWSLPGGAVELGETLEEAVVREVGEEVGLEVEVVELVAVLDRIFVDREDRIQFHYVLMDFLCRNMGGIPKASSDVLSCSLVPFKTLGKFQMSRETMEVIRRAHLRLMGKYAAIYLGRKSKSA